MRISDWSSDVCSSDLTPAVRTFSLDGARAAGGSVMPNGNYLVGERGPEILQMGGRGGSIVPNNQIGGGRPLVFDLRGAVMTEDLLRQMSQMADGDRKSTRLKSSH